MLIESETKVTPEIITVLSHRWSKQKFEQNNEVEQINMYCSTSLFC